MSTVKFTIKGDTSDFTSKMEALKKQYRDTLKSISKNNDDLLKKQQQLTAERNIQTTLTPRTEEMKLSNERISQLNRELRALKALSAELDANKRRISSLVNVEKEQLNINKQVSQSFELMGQNILTTIRRITPLISGLYLLKSAYDKTLGVGFDFNKVIEAETMGLKLLVVQNLANIDAKGKALTLQEKYNIAQKESVKMMEKIKNINPETPYNLADTVKVYKALYPQLIRYGATMDDIAEITKKFTIIAKVNNLEVDQFIRTVDTAFTGNMAQSQLKNVLERMGLDNKSIEEAIKNGQLLSIIKDKFKEVNEEMLGLKQTWANASSAFTTNWQTLWGQLQKPMFEAQIKGVQTLNEVMKNNMDTIKESILLFRDLVVEVLGLYSASKLLSTVQLSQSTLSFGGSLSLAKTKITDLSKAMWTFTKSNPLLVAMGVAMTAYEWATHKARVEQNKLNAVMETSLKTISEMSKLQAQATLVTTQDALGNERKKLKELYNQNDALYVQYGRRTQSNILVEAEIEKQKEVISKVEEKIQLLNDVIAGKKISLDTTDKLNFKTADLKDNVAKTADEAQRLSQNLIQSLMALHRTQRDMAVFSGSMLDEQRKILDAKEKLDNASKNFTKIAISGDVKSPEYHEASTALLQAQIGYKKTLLEIDKQKANLTAQITENEFNLYANTLKGANKTKAEVEFVNSKIATQQNLINGLQQGSIKYLSAVKDLDDLRIQKQSLLNSLKKDEVGHTKKTATHTAKAVKDTNELYKEYLKITGQQAKLKEINTQETLNKFTKAGYSKKQIAELKKALGKVNKEVTLDFATQFKNMFDSLLKGDIAGAVKGLFNGISQDLLAEPIKALSTKLSGMTTDLFGKIGKSFGSSDGGMLSGMFGQALGGLALGGIGSLLGNVLDGWLNQEETPPELESIHLTSESMAKSLDFIKNAQNPLLSYTKKQTEYLSIIAQSFGNIGNSMLASGIDFGGQFYQGSSKGGVFSSKTYELYGTSVDFEAVKMSDAIAGEWTAYSDEVIKKTYDSWVKHKVSYSHNKTDISDLIARDMAKATSSMFESIIASANLLDLSLTKSFTFEKFKEVPKTIQLYGLAIQQGMETVSDGFTTEVQSLLDETIDLGKIDTSGMTGTEIAQAIEERFGAEFDAIVGKYFGDELYEFQKAGEGLAETLNRVSVTFEQTSYQLGQIGQQVSWQNANYLVDASGGMEDFNSLWGSYIDNYYTDVEKWAMKQKMLSDSFAQLGVQMPETKSDFRHLIESFDVTDKASAELYASLLQLAPAFDEVTSSTNGGLQSLLEWKKKVLDEINGFWSSDLSYLNSIEKIKKLDTISSQQIATGQTDDAFQSLKDKLSYEKKVSSSREDYAFNAAEYLYKIKNLDEPTATIDDIVLSLSELKTLIKEASDTNVEVNKEVADAIVSSNYTL